MLAQNKHFNKIKKKLFAIINARANKNEKMVSTHYPTSFDKLALFFRKIPT